MFQYVQPNAPRRVGPITVQSLDCRANGVERAIDCGLQFLPGGCQRDAPVRPIEQAHAKPGFEALQGMAERRCADAQLQAGAPKIVMLRYREKVAEIREVGATDLHVPSVSPDGLVGNRVEIGSSLRSCLKLLLHAPRRRAF